MVRRESTGSWPSSSLQAELQRVGVTLGTAGYASAVLVLVRDESDVTILDPPGEDSERSWEGSEAEALDLLATLPDDAGLTAFWAVFDKWP